MRTSSPFDSPFIQLPIIPLVAGFVFQAGTGISFRIWFFYLIAALQEGITSILVVRTGMYYLTTPVGGKARPARAKRQRRIWPRGLFYV